MPQAKHSSCQTHLPINHLLEPLFIFSFLEHRSTILYKVNRFIHLQYCPKHNILHTSLPTLSPQMSNTEIRLRWSFSSEKRWFRDEVGKPQPWSICNRMPPLRLTSFVKRSSGESEYILSISQIIFHKVRAPVTCWEVVVHHRRAANSVMDGVGSETLLWHFIFLSRVFLFFFLNLFGRGAIVEIHLF